VKTLIMLVLFLKQARGQ